MIEQINHIAQIWWSGTLAMFWQVGVLIILIGCVDLIIRRWAWPQLRYALWLMVLVKLVLPPTISLSTSVTSKLQPLVKNIATKEIKQENLDSTTAMIFTNLETAKAELEPYRNTVSEQPAVVFTAPENVAGESLAATRVKPTWQTYAMASWLTGMFALGGWLIVKLLHLRQEDYRIAKTATLPKSFYDSLARCAERLELRRVPKVVLTRRVACPAVFGMFRPVLLMPVGYLSKMTRSDTEHMLLHELAHIKRGDLCVHGFYMLLQIVYWYNPLLWLVRSQMHHLRELCCDATVARLLRERISEYRQTLIDVAKRYLTKPTEPGLGLLGLFEDSNRLLVRLNWLKKETWRYQKMKMLTVITTIILMLTFVIPMAQAQDKPATEESNAESVKTEEQQAQNTETAEAKQQQFQNQQQLSQALQALQKQLQQLEIEKQKLQHELHAMEHTKHTQHAEHAKHQAELKAKDAALKAKEVKNKADKASKEAEKAKDKAAKVKAQAEVTKTKAKQWEQQAQKMQEWAQQYAAQINSPEFQGNVNNLANNPMVEWVNSDEFKQWQKQMQQWSKQYATTHEQTHSSDHAHDPHTPHEPHPMPVMPAMPPMPPMPVMPLEAAAPNVEVPAPSVLPSVVAPVEPQTVNSTINEPTPVLPAISKPKIESARDIETQKNKDGKYEATKEMQFVSKVKPGSPFVVRNSLGNIFLKPSKNGKCDVKAVIKGKADSANKASAMVEQVSMNIHSSDERYYLKPVKKDGGQWNNLSVDLHITVPSGVILDVKTDLGNIEIYNFKGKIKTATDLGLIKAVNSTGNVELFTKLGAIEFIAPKNLSANLKAYTKMGEIQSELPLEVKKLDMFKRNTEGIIGTGRDNIKMATDMGKISLKWQSSSQVEVKY